MKKSLLFLTLIIVLTGCQSVALNQAKRSVEVNASATVYAKADVANFAVSISELAQTTVEAQQSVNSKVATLLEVLISNNVLEKNIKTTNLNIYPEYRYKDGEQILVGQRVTQSLYVVLTNVDKEGKALSTIIDELSQISNISVNSITFGKENTDSEYSLSRVLAINKAYQKASEYANAANLKVGKPLKISENANSNYLGAPVLRVEAVKALSMDSLSASVPTGELEITTTISVVYELK
ncbi:MAG: SIMPL domain-containing protein [Candidatus Cloacimonetes bacterium]|nr:SIMPL domain-containing protein [Candidatus Cloacimonadota bacterium]